PLWIRTLAVRMDATDGAEAMLDLVLVEQVHAGVLLGRQHPQALAWHEPHQHALSLTHAAIARNRSLQLPKNFKCHAAAVTASLVIHRHAPIPRRFARNCSLLTLNLDPGLQPAWPTARAIPASRDSTSPLE